MCRDGVCVVCLGSQGPEGASAAAHALSLPADAYGNDVSGHFSSSAHHVVVTSSTGGNWFHWFFTKLLGHE